MEVKEHVQKEILNAISEIGSSGATIIQIEKKVSFERHTLSKYLSFMQGHGLICHKIYGKAKVWFINKAPLQTIVNSVPETRTYIENVLFKLVSGIPLGIIVIDKNYGIQFMNDAMLGKYGELHGENFYKSILGLENPLKLKEMSKLMDGSKSGSMQITDRQNNILDIKVSHLQNPDQSFSFILIIEDITKAKAAEEWINKFSTIVEQTGDMVMLTDSKGIIEYINPSFEKNTGYSKGEAIGKKSSILKSGKHGKMFYKNLWGIITAGQVYQNVIINKRKNGELFYEAKTITPLFSSGKITQFVSTGKDITEYVRSRKKN